MDEFATRAAGPAAPAAALGTEVTKADVVEYLKAFTLVLDRDGDGIVTVAALQEFYRSIGEDVDADTAKMLLRDLQLRCGCSKQDLKPYLDRQTFMETMVHRMQNGLHETSDMRMAFDMLDRRKEGRVDAQALVEMFSAHEEPLAIDEAQDLVAAYARDGHDFLEFTDFKRMMTVKLLQFKVPVV